MLFCGGTHLQITGMSSLSARARAPAKLCICIRFCLQIPDAGDASEQNGSLSAEASCFARSPMQIRLARSVRLSVRPSVCLSVCCYLCGISAVADKALITVEETGSWLSFSIARIRCSVRTTVKVGSAHAPSSPLPPSPSCPLPSLAHPLLICP